MVKRVKEKHSNPIDKSTENENNPRLLSASASNSPTEDLIVTLSDAYENKRARQVVEWEKLGRQELQRNQQRAT
jgi:hypothetical protein